MSRLHEASLSADTPAAPTGAAGVDGFRVRCFHVAGVAVAATLIWRLQAVWVDVPDHGFGWFVPLAAAYLASERWADRPGSAALRVRRWIPWTVLGLSVTALALLRLLLEPWPLWPAALWLFTAVSVALALGGITLGWGWKTARHFAFPLAFIAIALPWPSMTETYFVQPLRGFLAVIAAEALGLLGYPAIAHGTVLQVGGGMVGIDEACSGIRSLQAAAMAALFLGELQRFTSGRRVALLAIGVGLALMSNLGRTLFLSWQTALHGPAAVAAWHDPAGYALLGVCLGGLVLVCWSWRRHAEETPLLPNSRDTLAPPTARTSPGRMVSLSLALIGSLLAMEVGTQLWFARGDRVGRNVPRWTATLQTRPGYQPEEFTASMQQMMGCDTHELGRWSGSDGSARAGYVLSWHHGHTARVATQQHTPTVCLPLAGSRLVENRGHVTARVGSLEFPFDAYLFASERETMHVYYLAWDLRRGHRLGPNAGAANWFDWFTRRWRDVAEARRHVEATVMAVAIVNAPNHAAADQSFLEEVSQIVSGERL